MFSTFAVMLGLAMPPNVPSIIEPVSYKEVSISDRFWSVRQQALDDVTVKQQLEMLVKYKYRENFERTAKGEKGGYIGYVFNDSDVYKTIEACSYVLGRRSLPWLDKAVDEWITLIGKAQMPDGYLNCYFQLNAPDKKWQNLRDQHELYVAGHLFEAAAAHYEATGKRSLLDIAVKNANHIAGRFGPGKRMGYPGHPETELALLKLHKATGEQKYFDLASFFIENRGTKFFATEHNTPLASYNGEYWSDHVPIRDHEEIVGHAVRAAYLFTGVADYSRQKPDAKLTDMLDRVWRNTTEKRMFVTGGLGPSGSNEGFTVDYDLPTFTAYQESCASIANALWNFRMGLLHGESKYADVMETALYNGSLAGINLKGNCYFYVNPLASSGGHHRPEWHGCACCPPNLARIIGQVGGLAYAASSDSIYVNLYVSSKATIKVQGQDVDLSVTTNYPWDGKVKLTLNRIGRGGFSLKLRNPGWVTSQATIQGRPAVPGADGYLTIKKNWKRGDTVNLEFPMPVERIVSHPEVKDTLGMYALKRGPLIYCVEGADNAYSLSNIGVPVGSPVKASAIKNGLGELVVLETEALVEPSQKWTGQLFQPLRTKEAQRLVAIPYCMWDNRQPGEMRVWLSPVPEPAPLRGLEASARVSMSFISSYCKPEGLIDGFIPATSNPNSPSQMHFWPHKGGTEWAEIRWSAPVAISSMRIFWFDDTGRGEVRLPSGYKVEAFSSGNWVPVVLKKGSSYAPKLDVWNEVKFQKIVTDRLRMTITQPHGFATGIHEWQVFE